MSTPWLPAALRFAWLTPCQVTSTPSVRRGPWRRWRRLLAIGYSILAITGLYGYMQWQPATLLVGLLALWYAPAFHQQPAGSFRFGWLALAFMALLFLMHAKTIAGAALVCAIFLYRETFFRRVERTTPFILGLLTPVASYFADSFSFPIRLQLTNFAGRLIAATGLPVTVAGNSLTCRGQGFSVDPACMGLHMLIISLLAALLLMNYYQGLYRRRLSVWMISLLLLLTITFNIVANLLRIIFLVLLVIPPDNPMHGLLGLVFLGVYVLLPLLPLIRFATRRNGKLMPGGASAEVNRASSWTGKPRPDISRPVPRSRRLLAANAIVCTSMIILVLPSLSAKKPAPPSADDAVPGYTVHRRENSILQLDNSRSLVYIKPIPGFYYTDHTPTICWQGSGYTFTAVRETTVGGIAVFQGELEKDHQKLYTAWWYDDGIHQTTGPFSWRWDLIRGAPDYSVINITTATPEDLEAEVTRTLKTHPFRRLLGHAPKP